MAWGCTITDLAFERTDRANKAVFALAVPQPLQIEARGGSLNRIPVMGRSGAGKTTFLQILSAAMRPQGRSTVTWTFPDDVQIAWGADGPSADELVHLRRNYFGFAFQTPHVPNFMTIGEALSFGRELRGESRTDAKSKAMELVRQTFTSGLHGAEELRETLRFFNSYPGQLSGGQRQRASLLMALAKDPVVLFADEPTGSLDRQSRREMMEMLTGWLNPHRMLVWITHHENDPADTEASRYLLVEDGTVSWVDEAARESFGSAGC